MNVLDSRALVLSVLVLLACAEREPTSQIVARLMSEVAVQDHQQGVFVELEALGPEGVPYLVGRLNDFRPLPERGITLKNKSPKAFEHLRHYGAETVHDALAAILNQITEENFEFVYNGATNEQRVRNVGAWRSWCKAKYPDKSAVCDGAI